MRIRKWVAGLAGVLLGAQLLTAQPAMAADGDVAWQVPVGPSANSTAMFSTVYGGIDVTKCDFVQPTTTYSYGPNGVLAGNPDNRGCNTGVSTRDGITVVPAWGGIGDNNTPYTYPIYGHQGATLKWTSYIGASDCVGSKLEAVSVSVGNNGDIFGIAREQNYSSCTTGKQYVFGIRGTDGKKLFATALPAELQQYTGVEFSPFKQGVVLAGNVNPQNVFYYSLTGTLTRTTPITGVGQDQRILAMTPEGYVFATGYNYTVPAGCTAGGVNENIKVYGPAGTEANHQLDSCKWVSNPGSTGGTAGAGSTWGAPILVWNANTQPNQSQANIVSLGNDGTVLYQKFIPTGTQNDQVGVWPSNFWADGKGNVVVTTTYNKASAPNGNYFRDIIVYDALTGAYKGSVAASSLPDYDRIEGMRQFALGESRLFHLITLCVSEETSPCTQWAEQVYAIDFGAVGVEEPRGTMLSTVTNVPTPLPKPQKLKFSILGDSFTAARGVEPFDPDTGDCKQSENSWALQAARNKNNNLRVVANVACSGATTKDMVPDNNDSAPATQVERLPKGADVTALTAGGNDIDFEGFVYACLIVDCTVYRDQMMAKIETLSNPGKLPKLYKSVRNKSKPTGSIYVLTYGQELPANGNCATSSAFINGITTVFLDVQALTPLRNYLMPKLRPFGITWQNVLANATGTAVNFSESEVQLANDVTTALNNKIKEVATATGDQRLYVVDVNRQGSGFKTHTLCNAQGNPPYFHGVVATDSGQSFHQTPEGNNAYRREFERTYQLVQPVETS